MSSTAIPLSLSNKRLYSGVLALFLALTAFGVRAETEIIYREIFGRPDSSTGNISPTNFQWAPFNGSGTGHNAANHVSSDGTGKPTNVFNINAGFNLDGTTNAYAEGWHYMDGTRRLTFTPEYSFDISSYVPGSIVFSWHQGNAYTTAGLHVIVRIGSTWYVTVEGVTNASAVTAGGNFGLDVGGAVPVSMVFDPTAAKWQILNFDGGYNMENRTFTNSTVAITAGATPGGDLSGVINAFGLTRFHDNTGFGNSRFDAFTIEGDPDLTDPKAVTWKGNINGDWDFDTLNWQTGGIATNFSNRDFVTMDETLTGNPSINVTAGVRVGSLTVNNPSTSYSFTGSGFIYGTGGLTKQGAGTLTIANTGVNAYTGGTLISAGTVNIGTGGTGGNLPTGTSVTNNGALVFNRSDSFSVSNTISGTGGLTKNGSGTMSLLGTSSYAGTTLVNAGTFLLNGSLTGGGALTAAAGTTLGGSGSSSGSVSVSGNLTPGTSAGTLTAGALTLATGATATFELGPNTTIGSGVNDLVQVNGNLTLNNNALTLWLLDTPQLGVPYRLINYTGSKSGNFNSAVPVANGRYTATLDQATANQINVTLGGAGPSVIRWASTGNTIWENGIGANWFNVTTASGPDVFFDGDTVIMDDTATVTTATLGGPLSPLSVSMTNSAKNYTLTGTGKLTGTMPFFKTGTGLLTLDNGSNDFTGGFTIDAGAVRVGTGGTGGGLGNGTVTNNGTLTVNKTDTLTIAGHLAGTGPLTNNGSGTTILASANSFSGGITINSGAVRLNVTAAGGTGAEILVNSGATLAGGGTQTNPVSVTSGTVTTINSDLVLSGAVTVASATINRFISADHQTPTTTRNIQLDGPVNGSGTIFVSNADNNTNPDSGQGVRFRGPAGNFSGVVIYTNNTKGEIRVADAGPFSPLNTGKIQLRAGDYTGANGQLAPAGTGYTIFNLNPLGGTTEIPTDFEVLGAGAVVFNGLGGSSVVTLGNLRVSGGQEVIGYRGAGATTNTAKFNSVTLTGGTVTFSPKSPTFGATGQAGTHLTLNDVSQLSASSLVMNGHNTLTLSGTINYTGTTTLSNGTTVVDGSKSGGSGMTVESTARLGGIGSISENVTINGGTLAPGDAATVPSSLTIDGNLTLNSTTNVFVLAVGGQNTKVIGVNTLAINGTGVIQVSVSGFSPLDAGEEFTLFEFSGTLPSSTTNNLQIVQIPGYTFRIVDPNTTPNQLRLEVLQASKDLHWMGSAGNNWAVGGTANWANNVSCITDSVFTALDFVTFDNCLSTATNVVLVGALEPSRMNVLNTFDPMFFTGSGNLTGSGSVRFAGDQPSYIANTGSNDFTGIVAVDSSVVNVISGGLGNGSLFLTNAGAQTLVFSPSGTLHVNNNISGTQGFIRKTNTGIVRLNGTNSYSAPVAVEQGTLIAGTDSALGATNATTISSGATLDVNARNLGSERVIVGGSGVDNLGAIVNNGTAGANNALRFVVIASDVTFGGTARWDIRGGPATLQSVTPGNPVNITKKGTNQVSLVAVTNISPDLNNIIIEEGVFAIQTTTTQLGDPNGTVTIHTNATLNFFNLNTTPFNKQIVAQNGGTIWNESGNTIVVGPITLNGVGSFNVAGTALILSNNAVNGTLSRFTKTSGGSLQFVGNALPSTTALEILGGTLDLTRSTVTSISLGSGQSLRGNGSIFGDVTAGSGSSVFAGLAEATGTLTVSNTVTLQSGSQTTMKLNAGTTSSDRIVTTNIVYGGTLVVTNIDGTLAGGQSFQLFAASGYSGTFSSVQLPTLGGGLSWTNTLTTDGRIAIIGGGGPVINTPRIVSAVRSGLNLIMSGTNGTTNGTFYVITSTNIATPLTNWAIVSTNAFGADGTFSVTNAIDATKPRQFFDLLQQVP